LLCKIDGITHKGEGVGRIDGQAVFIPFALPGETVEIEITEKQRRFSRGRVLRMVNASRHRSDPLCPYFGRCGGCAYQHASYAEELRLKRQVVSQNLQRIGKLDIEVQPVLGSADPYNYRNKVEWHLYKEDNSFIMGYYDLTGANLLDIDWCPLLSQRLQETSSLLKRVIKGVAPDLKGEIVIRHSLYTDRVLIVFKNMPQLEAYQPVWQDIGNQYAFIQGIVSVNHNKIKTLYGLDYLEEKIGSKFYRISPLAFFQVNTRQTQILYELVKKLASVTENQKLLDAYCGAGTIAIYLADQARQVLGLESFQPAVEDAFINARLNNIGNCHFVCAPCEKFLPKNTEHFDLAVIDPPRAGCKPAVIQALTEKKPDKIVYVSCNPATLARDLKIFVAADYNIIRVQPVDMFPRTSHVECVVLMSRAEK